MHRNRVWISTTILLLAALSAIAQTDNTSTGAGANPSNSGSYNTADGYDALNNANEGNFNTAVGWSALMNNAQAYNTAVGVQALQNNSSGTLNTAIGEQALSLNLNGNNNTAIGAGAGGSTQESGSDNTFVGAGTGPSSGNLNNATAIGAYAEVGADNSLVLGAITGVGGCEASISPCASINVGIGTTTPAATLDINGNTASSGTGTPASGPPGIHTYIGSACNSSAAFAGIAFGTAAFQNCANYSLLGDGTNTYVNAPSGEILLRINNENRVVVTSTGITLSGTLSYSSDRNLKEGFAPVEGASLLTKLNAIPMQTWKYKTERPGIRHLGPMAQDFRAAFGLGEDDKHISTVDEGGVALAAVQELYREGLKKDATIRDLQAQIKADRLAAKAEIAQERSAAKAQIEQLAAQVKMVQAALASSGQSVIATRTVSTQLASVR